MSSVLNTLRFAAWSKSYYLASLLPKQRALVLVLALLAVRVEGSAGGTDALETARRVATLAAPAQQAAVGPQHPIQPARVSKLLNFQNCLLHLIKSA